MGKSLNVVKIPLPKIVSCPENASTFGEEPKIYLEKKIMQLKRNVTDVMGFLERGLDIRHLFPTKSERQRKNDF